MIRGGLGIVLTASYHFSRIFLTAPPMPRERPFQIGEFTFDPNQLTVSGPEGVFRLAAKLMAVAAYLANRAGEVVTREELIRDVWDDYPSADQSLSNAVSGLRRLLDDARHTPQLIQTVPKRGYRLLASQTRVTTTHGMVVLPFRNIGEDPEDQYLCEGLAEELLNALARVAGLRVVARSAVFAMAQQEFSLEEVGCRLDADLAIEGGVQHIGSQVRVWVRLVDMASAGQLWSREFRMEWANLFELQDVITRAVMQELEAHLGLKPPAADVLDDALPVDPEAFACYLKGRYFWYRENLDPGKALAHFHRSIELAPHYAPPYAGLVDCYCTYAYWQLLPQPIARAMALDYAARAREIDPDSTDGHFSQGYTLMYMAWDWMGAEAEFRRALERKPEHLLALSFLALCCVTQRRDAEGWELSRRLLRADPVSGWCHFIAGGMAYLMRDFHTAAEWATQGLELAPGSATCLWCASVSLAELGDVEAALPLIRQLEQAVPDSDFILSCAAAGYALCGARSEAEAGLRELRRRDRKRGVSPLVLARALAPLGYEDEAIEALQTAYDHRITPLFDISRHTVFDRLRHRPEFQKILQDLGLPSC
jgi:TolB-like protein